MKLQVDKKRIANALRLMKKEYGRREPRERGGGQGQTVAVLIQTILSQNTSDGNSGRAFASLMASFDSWDEMVDASTQHIAGAIRCGGLGGVKGKYIQQALSEIKMKQGDYNLDFLKLLPLEEARDWLLELPGVGMKTASCVLLFGLGMPAMPVDTHVFRVVKRLRLIDAKTSVGQAHRLLEKLVSAVSIYPFHILLIEHGRKTCKARNPLCRDCVLRQTCPSCGRL